MDAWSTAIDDFLAGRRSPQTRRAYALAIERYVAFLESRKTTPAAAAPKDVAAWTKSMSASANTARARLAAVSALYDYVAKHTSPTLRSDNPTRAIAWPNKQAPKRKARDRALDADKASELLDSAGPREQAIVALMCIEGLRCAEVCALRWEDCDGATLIVTGKGGKRRFLHIADTTIAILEAWAKARGRQWGDQAPMFPGRDGTISNRQAGRIIRALGAAIGVDLSPHPLRATAISEWLAAGASLIDAQRAAGHTSPSTTEGYAVIKPPAASSKSRIRPKQERLPTL